MAAVGRGVRIAGLNSAPSGLARSRRLVAAAPSDDLLFLIELSGRARIEQDGQQLELRAGSATFCDPSVPYSISGQQIVAMIPRHEVLPHRTTAGDIRLRPLSMDLAPLRVFRLLADDMTADRGSDTAVGLDGVATAATDLLRSAAGIAATAEFSSRSFSADTRRRAVQEYLLAHLADPSITMGRVAAANGISVRGLTALFAPDDSPAAFLRRERLRRAMSRHQASGPRWISTPVSTIGARWGFLDASTFGRAFRREFGSSPAGYRAEASGPV